MTGAVLGSAVLASSAVAQPGGGGGTQQPCLYQDHLDQVPEFVRPFIVGHSVDYDVVVAEEITLVFLGDVLHDFVQVDAECELRPCEYDPGEFQWSYTKETGAQYTVGASQTWSIAGELAIKLVGKISIGSEFVLHGEYSRNTKETETISLSIPIDMCYDKLREVYKTVGISEGWVDVVSQRYVWDIDIGGTIYGFTTDCGKERLEGDADKVNGWRADPSSTECEDWPDCGLLC
ncbi:MAG: hypothetical protein Q9O74_00475 [Planctomycetota bacterium]|nr:hypothetical protein [Planctomycetota bacterium]